MKILIVEDEPPIAYDIKKMCESVLEDKDVHIHIVFSFDQAKDYLSEHAIDLCLLDLNLNGKNGYDILKQSVASSFHTIIISAYVDQAIYAFDYGVLDFIPKPFEEKRLRKALDRYFNTDDNPNLNARFLAIKDMQGIRVIPVQNILYFKGADNYVEAYLKDGHRELVDKPIYRLVQILPSHFKQIHRSYVIDLNKISFLGHVGCGQYQVKLNNQQVLPVSRQKYKELKLLLGS